ncbi:endonuclease/exonuclease/phosphatase family protein [Rufibacter roseus]|uniref:Endonuclease/exonuclease/phosphatase family protein n=1 Tax=Rufibacter roseus TaxID=1567108 RepID=A0ABW2DFY4_9BACT|nr:endonuclease/exonuclease/phosphatase family protein [Rufibacter roseus]
MKTGNWKATVFIMVMVFFAACGKDDEPAPVTQPDTPEAITPDVMVMTYNIHLGNPPSAGSKRDLPAIARVINEGKPDMVALQEVDRYTERSGKTVHQARELGKLTNMYSFYVKAMDVFGGGEYGIAILSKYPFIDTVGYELPADPRVGGEMRKLAVARVALPSGKEIVFASTHLDHKSEQNRLYQGERILRYLKGETRPVMLAGDFNALPGSATVDLFDNQYTRTCRHTCSPTFPAYNPKSAIDFIMFRSTDKMKVASHKIILESYASDHLPVVAGLKLN